MRKTLVILLIAICFNFSCATTWEGKKPATKKPPQQQTTVTKQKTVQSTVGGTSQTKTTGSVKKDVIRPDEKQVASSAGTPARSASTSLVSKGKRSLDEGDYAKALNTFKEAILIDSTNGVAYYYMAKTQFMLQNYDQAMGILDKAESLLQNSDEWLEAIKTLREQIRNS